MISPDAPLFTELYAAFKCTACGCVCEYWDGASFKEKLGLSFRTCPDCGGKLKYTKKSAYPSDSRSKISIKLKWLRKCLRLALHWIGF